MNERAAKDILPVCLKFSFELLVNLNVIAHIVEIVFFSEDHKAVPSNGVSLE